MTFISVIICSHNPRPDYLRRVLDALRAQTLPQDQWELIIVDNRSDEPLEGRFDISWHPHARYVREDELGLTPARLRGIAEAKGHLLVFVDDDNVLAEEYLATALSISEEYPFLAAWGAGLLEPEFETTPPVWSRPHWGHLAIRQVPTVRWSNGTSDWDATPVGAGLCVRRQLAERYYANERASRYRLGRAGRNFSGGEDLDMVYTASQLGLGWATFPTLKIKHLIPAERLSQDYLLRLTEGYAASNVLLAAKHQLPMPTIPPWWRILLKSVEIFVRSGRNNLAFFLARQKGISLGYRTLQQLRD